mmetsp:Transcript_5615/g.9373  ORF Transcript_5615/g.9373 Transcript_5615/m.9373 type:complete len:135 (+) Transcript_5615:830-1234(+)
MLSLDGSANFAVSRSALIELIAVVVAALSLDNLGDAPIPSAVLVIVIISRISVRSSLGAMEEDKDDDDESDDDESDDVDRETNNDSMNDDVAVANQLIITAALLPPPLNPLLGLQTLEVASALVVQARSGGRIK